jgi:hypothetical protein
MKKFAAAAALLAAVAMAPAPASAQDRVQAGTLVCDVSGGLGLIIGSQKQMTCQFEPSDQSRRREVYFGVISKFGLDIGATAGGQMVWAVYAPTDKRFAALSGTYVGGSAEATIGVGLGANVLVGGSDRTIALQPLSIQGQTGLNLAAGVTEIQLSPAR